MSSRSTALSLALLLSLAAAACGDDGSVLGGTSSTAAPTTSTTAAPPETTTPPETTAAPPETTAAPPETTAAPPETTAAPPAVPVITPDETAYSNADPPLEITVTTPVVSGIPPAAAGSINGAIAGAIVPAWTGFRDEILAGEGDPTMPGVPSEYVLGYDATAVRPELLSLRFDVYLYYQGAAHGLSGIFTLNFDPQTGAQVTLAGLLVPGTVANVASRVEQALVDDLYGGDAVEAASWLPVIDASVLDAWVASADGLEFSFDQYEVGPGVFGSPTVVVPWADLAAVIDPAGPAGGLAFG